MVEYEFAYPDIIKQFAFIINNINYINGLTVLAYFANGLQHIGHSVVLKNINIVRRHQSANAVLRIAKQRKRYFSFFRRQQFYPFTNNAAWQAFQEINPVIR